MLDNIRAMSHKLLPAELNGVMYHLKARQIRRKLLGGTGTSVSGEYKALLSEDNLSKLDNYDISFLIAYCEYLKDKNSNFMQRYVQDDHLKMIDSLDVKKYKKSDTLFIFAPGATLNDIPREQWDFFRQHDSMGISAFLFHDFVPTYYVFTYRHLSLDIAYHNLEVRADDYKNVPKLYLKLPVEYPIFTSLSDKVRNSIYVDSVFMMFCEKEADFGKMLSAWEQRGYYKRDGQFSLSLNIRGTVISAVFWAYLAGYHKIVLCGVDFTPNYFYENNEKYYEDKGLKMFISPYKGKKGVHYSVDPGIAPLRSDQLIIKMNEDLLKPAGVELSIFCDKTPLAAGLPLYDKR